MKNTVGMRIRTRRKELNITMAQIQEKTSISSGNLSCIENGKYLPSATALIELSAILDCSIDWILTGKHKKLKSDEIYIAETKDEKFILDAFREMSFDDKEEFLAIAKIKDEKRKKGEHYHLEDEEVKIS